MESFWQSISTDHAECEGVILQLVNSFTLSVVDLSQLGRI